MERLFEYLRMGGHAAFIWPALGLTAVVLILMLVISLYDLHRSEAALRQLEAARAPRRAARSPTPETG